MTGIICRHRRRPQGTSIGFSLPEILAVIAIMTLLLVAAAPAVSNVVGGLGLTSAADQVVGQLKQARQVAITRNRNVQLRFYYYQQGFGSERRFGAMQSFIVSDDSTSAWKPLSRVQKLPARFSLDSGATLSPLIGSQAFQSGADTGVSIPGAGTDYKYVSITFSPNGSATIIPPPEGTRGTSLLIKDSSLDDPADSLPLNYAVVQIFPSTGLIRYYRP